MVGYLPSARRVTAMAGIVCVGLLAASCGTVRSAASTSPARPSPAKPVVAPHRAGIVPWLDRPAPPYVPPPVPSPKPPPAKYVPCIAADLSGHPGQVTLAAGSATRYLVLTNVSHHSCTLSGGPSSVTGFPATGAPVNLSAGAGPQSLPELIGPANLRPGQSARVGLTIPAMCPEDAASCGQVSFSAVALGIGGSGQVRVAFSAHQPFTVLGSAAGRVGVSTFGVPALPPPGNVSPLDVLTVTVAMPARVKAGSTLAYTVTLHNRSGHAVALRPCPSYEEYVLAPGAVPGPVRSAFHRYYLNCPAAPPIPAHGSVTFAMRVPVPAFTGKARAAKYGWILRGTTVQTGGAVTAVPASGASR